MGPVIVNVTKAFTTSSQLPSYRFGEVSAGEVIVTQCLSVSASPPVSLSPCDSYLASSFAFSVTTSSILSYSWGKDAKNNVGRSPPIKIAYCFNIAKRPFAYIMSPSQSPSYRTKPGPVTHKRPVPSTASPFCPSQWFSSMLEDAFHTITFLNSSTCLCPFRGPACLIASNNFFFPPR